MSGGAQRITGIRFVVSTVAIMSHLYAVDSAPSHDGHITLHNHTKEKVTVHIRYTHDGAMYTSSTTLPAHATSRPTFEHDPESIHSIEAESARLNISSLISPQEQWHTPRDVVILTSQGLGSFDIIINDAATSP